MLNKHYAAAAATKFPASIKGIIQHAKRSRVLHKINVLTLQIFTDLLLHFLGFVSPTTNQLWKTQTNKQLEMCEQLTGAG